MNIGMHLEENLGILYVGLAAAMGSLMVCMAGLHLGCWVGEKSPGLKGKKPSS